MDPRLETLTEIEAAAWKQLAEAVADKDHPWRTPVLATVDGPDAAPRADARTVVLREVDAASRTLLLYSDSRSHKVSQIRRQPHGMLVFWSPALGWQLRCAAALAVEVEGEAVAARWAAIRRSPAARDYQSPLPPGSPLDGAARSAGRRENFGVITATVRSVDWLELHPDGHRRARFERGQARWLQP